MNLRRAAERISRGVVLKRRVPPPFGNLPIYVSPEAGLRYWLPMKRVDATLYRMARELVTSGASVWDIGANVGLFSVCASALAGPSGFVLSVEPDAWLCHLLTRSAVLAPGKGGASIKVLCAAASSESRITSLQVSDRCRAASHLEGTRGSSQTTASRWSQPCITVSLDALLKEFPGPNVLKIDVETHELRVLQGATTLLKEIRPRIWCEVAPENAAEVADLLHGFGYGLYAAATPEPRDELPRRASWDTLAIPREQAAAARVDKLR